MEFCSGQDARFNKNRKAQAAVPACGGWDGSGSFAQQCWLVAVPEPVLAVSGMWGC